ncbi:MAG: cytochrome c biogenesis protein CcdA [Leeuwenhoekiella sp.]
MVGFAQFGAGSQMADPVAWSAGVEQAESDAEYILTISALIDPDWHVYSQYTPDGGPIPLEVDFLDTEKYTLISDLQESETESEFSEIFGVDEIFFAESAELTQRIKVTGEALNVIKAELTYQVCKEVCINGTVYLAFDLDKKEGRTFSNYDTFMAYGTSGSSEGNNSVEAVKEELDKQPDVSSEKPEEVVAAESQVAEDKGLWTIFIVAFLSGFIALLTPCVFPMIPMTVSFFLKQSKTKAAGKRNAILYGIFIVVIYVLLGALVVSIFGADSLNALATNVWFNLLFFVLLVVFAISFFGAFEIMLPQSWANAVDKKADRGGIIGILFMALALAIVSFSCTGPIVGTLLFEAASKGGYAPLIGMFGFSLAIAIPFALFALFPSWLSSLPKSGGWLNSVKVFLGFLELAFAFKFLSNADLVLQTHILEREVFIAIWIAIFGTLALYLFGKLKMSHDSPLPYISAGRLLLGLFVLSFTVYLIPGLWGAPLKLISGFPPPLTYSESPFGVGNTRNASGVAKEIPDGAELGPHQIITFTDYDKGFAFAKANDKPILIDFTGKACVNCRKMEERVWAEPEVLQMLKDDLVLISLFVDLKEKLPESEHYTSEATGKRIRTVGEKWSDFQIEKYQINAQPYYVLLDHEENLLNEPVGYTPDVEDYEQWLEAGIANFE